MSNSKFRRGVAVKSPGPKVAHKTAGPVGRVHKTLGRQPEPLPQSTHNEHFNSGIVDSTGVPVAARRQGLVTAGGEPIRRGLAKATRDGMAAESTGTEQCTRCGFDRPRASFRVLVSSSDSGEQIRVCGPCAGQAYKDPYTGKDAWRLQRQDVRFSRADGRPYDGSRLGAPQLINGDSYHEADYDSEVAPQLGAQVHGRVGKIIT